SNVAISISGASATGSYTYSTSGGTESGSTYLFQRADDTSGTNTTTAASGSCTSSTALSYSLTTSDNNKYLRLCVTPSDGTISGSQSCSSWSAVGHLLSLYKDGSFSGTNVNIAYEKSSWGTCFSMSSLSFDNMLSSLILKATSSSSTTVTLYSGTGCSGSSVT